MTDRDRMRIAIEVNCNPATVKRWEQEPGSVLGPTDYAIRQAAKKLGIELEHTKKEAST